MQQNLVYFYLVGWIVGGLMLLTIVLLRTTRRPFWLPFALVGFGGTGFLSLGLGWGAWDLSLAYALAAGALGAALGVLAQRLARVALSQQA